MNAQLRQEIERRYACRLCGDPYKLTGGYESDVWRWQSDRGDLAVRVSPAWRTLDELNWVHSLNRHCAASIPEVVAPLPDQTGATVFAFQQQPVSVFPYIAGISLDTTSADLCAAAARLLGQIHTVAQSWTGSAHRPASHSTVPQPLPPDRYPPELIDPELDAWHAALLQSTAASVGPHHGDFYEENVLCADGQISGVIDWDEAQVKPLILETGWSTWEFSQTDAENDLDDDKARAFLAAYMQTGPLQPAELQGVIPAIRWRLRSESVLALAAAERGEDWDREYTEREIFAFQGLKGRIL
jgi:Ser/Thr protein kinase RdoA (MazF antagonist)